MCDTASFLTTLLDLTFFKAVLQGKPVLVCYKMKCQYFQTTFWWQGFVYICNTTELLHISVNKWRTV